MKYMARTCVLTHLQLLCQRTRSKCRRRLSQLQLRFQQRSARVSDAQFLYVVALSDSTQVVEEAAATLPKKGKATKSAAAPRAATKAVTDDTAPKKASKAKKGSAAVVQEEDVELSAVADESTKPAKTSAAKAKKSKSKEVTEEPIDKEDEESGDAMEEDGSEAEVDDQTEALLKGFESSDDEDINEEEAFKAGQAIPKIDKKAAKKAKAAASVASDEKPGVVYLGRIPHGFYEAEMRAYFSQFGDISRLRLSRNRKTGQSKHFAFMEFKSAAVAEIVSKTMDNYLLFGHILKCKVVAPEQVHEKLFIGANKRFKKVPWNKLEGRKLKQGLTEQGWENRNEKEEKRRANKAEKLKAIGYEFEAPKLKSAKNIPKTPRHAAIAAPEENVPAAETPAESAPAVTEKPNKRQKKSKAAEEPVVVDEVAAPAESDKKAKKAKKAALEEVPAPAEAAEKPVMKSKKRKASGAEAAAPVEIAGGKKEPAKKAKKSKTSA